MALIKCPECGKEISDKSEKCIHCGFPLRNEPIIQEYINGKYYDVTFLKDKNISQAKKITMLCELTNNDVDLMEAKNIVLKYHPTKQQEQAEKNRVEENTLRCPNCHSTNIKPISGTERAVSIIGLGIFSKKINKSFKCLDCKYTW